MYFKMLASGVLVVCFLIVVSYCTGLMNGSTEEFLTGAFLSVAGLGSLPFIFERIWK